MHFLVTCATASLLSASAIIGQCYTVTLLPTVGGANSNALAINNSGRVVGTSLNAAAVWRPTLWTNHVASDIGTLGGDYGTANAINDANQVAGTTRTALNVLHATLWNGATRVDLGVVDNPVASAASAAYGINGSGRVVGHGQTADYYQHATLWRNPTEMHDINPTGQIVDSSATSVNGAGVMAGWINTTSNATPLHAATWTTTYVRTDLGTLGGTNSSANDINDGGAVVGRAQRAGSTDYHAALWAPGQPAVDLGTLGGAGSAARAINRDGVIVGTAQKSGAPGDYATLWQQGQAIDLNTLIGPAAGLAGWVLVQANDINDQGWIVGLATNAAQGVSRGFLLTPCSAAGAAHEAYGEACGGIALAASPAPVLGNTVVWSATGLPPGTAFSVHLLSAGASWSRLPLESVGAPGCSLYVDMAVGLAIATSGRPTATFALPLPNDLALVGATLNGQAAVVDLSANQLGVVTSNGVWSRLNAF